MAQPHHRLEATWSRLPPRAQDGLIATAVAVVSLGLPMLDLVSGSGSGRLRLLGVAGTAFVLATCLPLILRRRLPVSSTIACAVMTMLSIVAGAPSPPWAVLVAAVSAAYYCERHRPLLAIAAAGWMVAVVVVLLNGTPHPSDVLIAIGLALAPISVGYALRLQADRASQTRQLQEAERHRARARERTRIAGDVHDVVGHRLSAVLLQARGARRSGRPGAQTEALDTIVTLAAQAVDEVRGLVDVLRDDTTDTAHRLSDLDTLATGLRNWLQVEVHLDLARPEPPELLQYSAYRVAQESLTNVIRHSGARRAVVCACADDDLLVLTVTDDGPGHRPGAGGGGLRGMRERVELLGGTFSAGPQWPRGWRVRAELPVPGGAGQ